MTDPTYPTAAAAAAYPAPVENVSRGTLFALAAIPFAIIAFAIVAGFGFISGIVAVIVPSIAGWLYTKGAGAPLSRKGWGSFILVSAAAVVLGTLASIFTSAYQSYTSVGGSGLTSAYWTAVAGRFTNGGADLLFALLIGIGLGIAGIVVVLRGGGKFGAANSNRLTPAQTQALVADATAAPIPAAAPVAPPAAPAANQPSPGVMLNGKPMDPNAK